MEEENAKQVMIEAITETLEAATLAQLGALLKLIRGYIRI